MCVRPVHDLCQFIPVVNFFKFHLLDRCTGDDHTVVIIFPHILKFHIERVQMAGRCIFRLVACHHQKGDINLQGGVGKGAQKLQLGIFFERHQIQDHNLQRTDVLMNRFLFFLICRAFLCADRRFAFSGRNFCRLFPIIADSRAGCKPPLQIFRYSSVIFRNSSSEITGTPSSRAFRFLEELDVVSLLIR